MPARDKSSEKPRRDPRKRPTPVIARAPGKAGTAEPAAPRSRKRGTTAEADEGPRFIGGKRNEHGTRVARRITCTRCGAVDHVPYAPRDSTKALCRACAVEVLATYELGTKVKAPMRKETCNLCGTPFELPASVEDDGDPLCRNCLRGFTTWQGSVDVPFADRAAAVVETRASGTLVRKVKRKG